MVNDTISDMLTRIRNASIVRKKAVVIPYTKMNLKIAEILEKEGYILSFELNTQQSLKQTNKISNLRMIKIFLKYYKKYKTNYYKLTVIKNKKALSDFKNLIKLLKGKQGSKKTPCITNLKRISKPGLRIYVNQKELPRVLAGTGIYILSTSKGILTDREARFRGIGGEILCSIW
uniref:Small ribosomal subunit protein uS8c n=1 Tax=Uronema confervicola TaxID=764120 RepID=A0A6H1U710_9CHLO|nr:ribosomal protein S8 [Uronema confervicola]QIZ74167.1 ribosomal protein S8 [Uronema confervicola]